MPKLLNMPTHSLLGDVIELHEWIGDRELSHKDLQIVLVHLIQLYRDDIQLRDGGSNGPT